MRPLIYFLIAVIFSFSATAAEQPPDIKSLMTPEDFTAAGLDGLSSEQRAHLNEWLARYRQGLVDGPAPPKTPEQKAEEREIEIAAKLMPPFEGWSGKTVFKLDNGQVWRQRKGGKLNYRGDDYRVVISKNLFGFWEMKHIDTGLIVGVKRIK